ncbi:MAG: transcription termination/antitermination protein NusG [Oscillospiraceae bacterium]|nr:transcription termination/antitermination protein NusG [Oscillospiraceae bacterium]
MEREARWYVVHTYSAYENKVMSTLEKVVKNRGMQDQILGSAVPTILVEKVDSKGVRKEVEEKLYPGYVFVKIATESDDDGTPQISDECWWVVRNVRGVTGFVGPDNKATPLDRDKAIEMGVEKRRVEIAIKPGDMVNITHPNFDGFTGTVREVNPEEKTVKVAITGLFGKETLLDLELKYVEAVG